MAACARDRAFPNRKAGRSRRHSALAALAGAAMISCLLLALPTAVRAQSVETAHGGGGFALVLLDYRLALEHVAETLRLRAMQIAAGLAQLPVELAAALHRVTGGADPTVLAIELVVLLGVGLLARCAVWIGLIGGPRAGVAEDPAGAGPRLGRAFYRAGAGLLALGAFTFVTIGLAIALTPAASPARTLVLTYVTATLITLAAAIGSRTLFAPDDPGARLVPMADVSAGFVHRALVRLTASGAFGWLTAALLILSGMSLAAHLVLAVLVGALVAGVLIVIILQARPLVRAALMAQAGELSGPRLRVARSWHVFAGLYVAVVWLLWANSIFAREPSGVWSAIASILLIVVLPLLDELFGRGLIRALGHEEAGAARHASFAGAVRAGFRIVLLLGATIVLPALWGLDLLDALGAPGAEVIARATFDLTITGLLAYLVWQVADSALERRFGAAQPGDPRHGARVRTLRPLIRKFVLGALVVVWTMIALSAVGVDIGPLLAGAGVVGIALGFGAQTLVRDIVSGIFFLWDDAFRVGEYVEAGELRGTVEAISLRSLRLRHHRGPVHTIPFGELRSLTNHSRDWVIVKMELLVTYGTDIDRVKKILKAIGKEMLQDPELGPKLIEPLKSQGIHELRDSGILVRAKFTARPGEQFLIRREAYKRIKLAFEANGIQFAYPTVMIHAPAPAPASSDLDPPGGGNGAAGGGDAAFGAAALAARNRSAGKV